MKYVYALATIAALATPAFAAQTMSSLPPDSFTVTDYYKQDVYDHSKNTVGKIDDVLIDKSGKIRFTYDSFTNGPAHEAEALKFIKTMPA